MNITSTVPFNGQVIAKDMKARLMYWYSQRFVAGKKTTELMEAAHLMEEAEALSIVALLDVNSEILAKMMSREEFAFVQACHVFLKSLTEREVLSLDPAI